MDSINLTWGNLMTIGGVAIGIVGLIVRMAAMLREFERQYLAALEVMRAESSAARAKLYDRLEAVRLEMATTYVRQDVHAETQARLLHALEEYSRILAGKAAVEGAPPPASPRVRRR